MRLIFGFPCSSSQPDPLFSSLRALWEAAGLDVVHTPLEPGESDAEDVPERELMPIFFGADVFFVTVARFLMQRLSISLSNLASSKKLYLSSLRHRAHGTNVRTRSVLEI